MARQRGWWNLSTNTELSDVDLEHIAEMILNGFTSGEVIQDDDEEGVNHE